jgi:hypothetical protein
MGEGGWMKNQYTNKSPLDMNQAIIEAFAIMTLLHMKSNPSKILQSMPDQQL